VQFANALLMAIAMAGPVAAEPTPREVVSAMFDAFHRHEVEAMARLYVDDARLTSPGFCTPRAGRAEVIRTYRELFTTFPGLRDDLQDIVVDGDRVAVRFIARNDAPAVELPITAFFVIRHGRVITDDSTFDRRGRPCAP
jgi:limonene-1,2-epoxide hydrolase